ncbi:hypothetical protein AB6A40_008480 [Gnathostoma spinigerum]|uniref:TTI1 C-terminal TPR domain-containing protein n=1 Tax=Gnathostoma spinigerum TaxID=75299 RepID=A0ABD6EPK8_9BILA
MNDSIYQLTVECCEKKKENSSGDATVLPIQKLSVERDPTWFKDSARQINKAFAYITSRIVVNPHHEIRAFILDCSLSFWNECSHAFRGVINTTIIDLSVLLLTDDYDSIQSRAMSLIEALRCCDREALHNFLLEKLFKISSLLPTKLRDDHNSAVVLKEFKGTVIALGPEGLNDIIRIGGHPLERFVLAVASSIRIDYKRLRITQELTNRHELGCLEELSFLFGLNHSEIKTISAVVAQCSDLSVLLDHILLEVQHCEFANKLGYFVFVAFILSSSMFRSNNELFHTLIIFTERALLMLDGIDVEESVRDDVISDMSVSHSSETCLVIVLLTVTSYAAMRANSSLRSLELLTDLLYLFLKWTSSGNVLCRESAEMALKRFASVHTEAGTVQSLISLHKNILVSRIAIYCRQFYAHLHAPTVLAAILDHSGECEIFDTVRFIIPQLLLALDTSYQDFCCMLLRALLSFVRAVQRWYPELKPDVPSASADQESATEETMDGENPTTSVKVDEKSEKPCTENELCDEKIFPPPPQIVIVVDILKRTKHLVSTPHLPIRLLVLDILDTSLRTIRYFERELLPMIHQNWLGLRSLFNDKELRIRARVVQVVATMCEVSASFVYRRVKEEFWPGIYSYMMEQAKRSVNAGSAYALSSAYIFQKAVLQNMQKIWMNIDPQADERNCVKDILAVYNTPSQPKELSRLARENLAVFKNSFSADHNV